MTIKLALVGATGRAGSEVLRVLPEFPSFMLQAAIVSETSSMLGRECSLLGARNSGVCLSADLEAGICGADAVLEFSGAAPSVRVAELCGKHGKPVVIASTGHTAQQLARIREQARACAMIHASNLSLGVFALKKLCLDAQRILGTSFQVEIFELHHRHKKDAPSGTALSLGASLAEGADLDLVSNRGSVQEPRADGSIGVASLRGGEVLGEHTVFFLGNGERLELTHRTADRGIFARGGLRALLGLAGRSPGLYQLSDVFA